MTRIPNRKAFAYILALVLLVAFVALAAALATSTGGTVEKGRNLSDAARARMAAEGGLGFALRDLRLLGLSSATTTATAIANIGAALGGRLNGTDNLAGGTVAFDSTSVTVPWIQMGRESFRVRVLQNGDGSLWLYVTGQADGINRDVSLGLKLVTAANSAFNYGLASRGAISVSGNAEIRGKNALTEASVVSTTSSSVAIAVGGNCVIDGDLSTTGSPTSVAISGNPTIAGSTNPNVIAQHVHFGVDPPAFPTVDTSVFKPLTTSIIDKTTDTSHKGTVFDNPRIKAGTNPTFSSDVVLNGIVYVEAPNIVTFASKVTLNGLVATDAAAGPIENCKISFAGQVEAFGVDALPNLPQYAAAKAMTGTFIAAPGFDVSFAGQFTTINGTVAADKLTFSGQASGTVKGSVIGLANLPTSISGTVDIIIDRSAAAPHPAGFGIPLSLDIVPRTYGEGSP